MTGSGLVASFSYPRRGDLRAGWHAWRMADSGRRHPVLAEPTDAGYAIYSLPLSGGASSQIYARQHRQ